MNATSHEPPALVANADALRRVKHLASAVYALQAIAFVMGLSYFLGALFSYVLKAKTRGTWLESHFDGQIGTFWLSLLVGVVGALALSYGSLGLVIIVADMAFMAYRIAQGWARLSTNRPLDPEQVSA